MQIKDVKELLTRKFILFCNSDFGKEQSHENGFVSTDTKINVTSPLKGKWIGFKFIIYNLPPTKNCTMPVKLENWINKNADDKTWKKVDDKIDDGGWRNDAGRCEGFINFSII